MTDRDAIAASALVGTAVTPPPALAGEPGLMLAAMPATDAESTLLAAAGVISLWSRCGMNLTLATDTIVAAPTETRRHASREALDILTLALETEDRALISEWVANFAAAGRIAEPEQLPSLLDFAVKNSAQADAVRQVAGERGAWLAEIEPGWKTVAAPSAAEAWETAPSKDRPALIGRLRAENPDTARETASAAMAGEPAAIRAKLVAALAVGLSRADEAFLEKTLDDKSKEVREETCDLLARIPGSAFSDRMMTRAAAALRVVRTGLLRRKELQIVLPSESDPADTRDGLDIKSPPASGNAGEKALKLLRLLVSVSPERLVRDLAVTPDEFFELAAKTEWAGVLRSGVTLAAIRHGDAGWARARLDAPSGPDVVSISQRELLSVLPPDERATRALRMLPTEADAAVKTLPDFREILAAFPDGLPRPVAMRLLAVLRTAIATRYEQYEYSLAYALGEYLSGIPADCAADAAEGWKTDGEWAKTLAPHLGRLRLRGEIFRISRLPDNSTPRS